MRRRWPSRSPPGPTFAHAMTKRCIHQEWNMGIDEAIEAEAQAQAICMQTKDYERAYEAFVAKQKPPLQGGLRGEHMSKREASHSCGNACGCRSCIIRDRRAREAHDHGDPRQQETGEKMVYMSVPDYTSAKWAEMAGVDVAVVGDSLAMIAHGHPSTIPATMDMMVMHAQAIRRGAPSTFVLGCMPYQSYNTIDRALTNATRFMQEARCDAVKPQGGKSRRTS